MATINVETKFDIGDSVFGFVDGEIHNLVIDRIEVSIARYKDDNPYNQINIIYLATTTDAVFNHQNRFKEGQLFTEDEVKSYIEKYFKRRTY